MNNESVNYKNYNLDLTVRVFDKFYNYDINVPAGTAFAGGSL